MFWQRPNVGLILEKLDTRRITFAQLLPNCYPGEQHIDRTMQYELVEVDELIRELGDYTNDDAHMATEELIKKCSSSWEAFQYLQNRADDVMLPDGARTQIHLITAKIRTWINLHRQYGWREPAYSH